MSAQQLITEHIDQWTSTIKTKNPQGRGSSKKRELYGIKKLRELILELAVRGKLVPQDPNDEPASVLLERIAAEKAQLIKDKKIKKQKLLPEITKEEKPFELPTGWEWLRLTDAGHDWGQKTPEDEFKYIDVGSINKELGIIINPKELSANEAPSRARKIVKNGTIIYSTVRPYLLNIAVINDDFYPEPIASTAFAILHPFSGLTASFIYRYLRSPAFITYVESVQTGIAYPAINDKQFFSGIVPVPPTSEQHRIVAKVDELMALCDQLEQQTESSLDAHKLLVDTMLSTLTDARDANELSDNWARLADHFDTLITTDYAVELLKQTILQLAVMGKLVPQDPNDEPASELLKRIAAEKEQLVIDKKIKKQKPLPKASEEEKSFEVPNGWVSAYIPQVVASNKYAIKRGPFGSALKKAYFVASGYKVYEQQHAINDDFYRGEYYVDESKFTELSAFSVHPNDLIISCSGTVGRVAVAPRDMQPGIINQALLKITLNERALTNQYFKILFPAFYMKTKTLNELKGTAQKNMVSVDTLKKEPFPLPSLAEQHRIVAKVDELMTLCDQLKAQLNNAQTTQLHLSDALVDRALNI